MATSGTCMDLWKEKGTINICLAWASRLAEYKQRLLVSPPHTPPWLLFMYHLLVIQRCRFSWIVFRILCSPIADMYSKQATYCVHRCTAETLPSLMMPECLVGVKRANVNVGEHLAVNMGATRTSLPSPSTNTHSREMLVRVVLAVEEIFGGRGGGWRQGVRGKGVHVWIY